MDEAAAAEIRKWAWEQYSGWSTKEADDDGKETFKPWAIEKRMCRADELAAWVMSGKLAEQPVQPATDQ